MSPIPPIRREVLVDSDPATAFEVFTARIGDWWPLASHSLHGQGATVAFEDGELIERSPAGEPSRWGTVTRWSPPDSVAFTWQPGRPEGEPSYVAVSFAAAGKQTLVTLEHSRWEVFDDPAAIRAEYETGWPAVLEEYRMNVGRHGDPGAGRITATSHISAGSSRR